MDKDTKLKQINQDVTEIVSVGNEIQIENQADLVRATEFLNQVVARIRRIEELRVQFTKPILDAKKLIDDEFKLSRTPLEEMERSVKSMILEYRRIEADRLEKERIKKLKEAEKAEDVGEQQKAIQEVKELQQDTVVNTESGSGRFRKVWTFDIINPTKVPKKYMKIDEVAIRKAIREGERKITGVKIFQEERISSHS